MKSTEENMAANQLALAYAKATQQVLEFSGKKAMKLKRLALMVKPFGIDPI